MQLLSFGSNSLGQLALSHTEDVSIPSAVNLPLSLQSGGAISISSSGNHTLLLHTPPGTLHRETRLYASGDNSLHQCGIPREPKHTSIIQPETNYTTFRLVPLPPSDDDENDKFPVWRMISTGWSCSHLVSFNEHIYACGQGAKGELGLGALENARVPMKLPDFPPLGTSVVHIASGVSHTVVILSDSTIYGWGVGRKGQLGSPNLAEVRMPRRIEVLPIPIGSTSERFVPAKAVCGRTFTAFISVEGNVVVIGEDKHGVVSNAPKVALTGWKDLGAGWGAVYVLMNDGRIMAWGRNTHGQLPPDNLLPIKRMAVGSEHVVAEEKGSGRVLAWGWGEHGNCGELSKEDGECVRRVKEIYWSEAFKPAGNAMDYSVAGIGAGCATSWVIIE